MTGKTKNVKLVQVEQRLNASTLDESAQWLNNFSDNVLVHVSEYVPHFRTGNAGSLIEHYLQNRVELHVHLLVGFSESVCGQYCVVYNVSFASAQGTSNERPLGLQSLKMVDDRVEEAMLVDVRQIGELPKEIVAERIPSLVRLQPLDDCLRCLVHRADLARTLLVEESRASTSISVPIYVPEDRELTRALELSRRIGGRGVNVTEGIDQVIERGSQVVENVADDQGEINGGQIFDFDPQLVIDAIVSAGLVKKGVVVSIEPPVDMPIQICQVMVRPT